MMRRRAPGRGLLLLPATAIMLVVIVAPVIELFLQSLAGSEGGSMLALASYRRFFGDPFFLSVLLRTYGIALLVDVICLLVGWPVAYQLSRTRGRRRLQLTLVILVPLLISVVVRSYGWVVLLGPEGVVSTLLQTLGLIDGSTRLLFTPTAVVIGEVQTFLPLMILPIASALDNLDPALLRAAGNLGATPLQTLRRIVFPLSMPGVLAGSTIVFSLSASAYVTPALLGGSRIKFMSTLIYQYNIVILDWAFGAALAVILLSITAGLLALYSRAVEQILFRGVFQP